MHNETSPIVLEKVQITGIIAVRRNRGGKFEVCDAIYLTNVLLVFADMLLRYPFLNWVCIMHFRVPFVLYCMTRIAKPRCIQCSQPFVQFV